MWAKLLQARARARGPALLVLWYTVREKGQGQSKGKKSGEGEPGMASGAASYCVTRGKAERVAHTHTQQVDSQGST